MSSEWSDYVKPEKGTPMQLLEAMHRRDEAAIMSFGLEAHKVKLIINQLECHTLGLAPAQALFLDF